MDNLATNSLIGIIIIAALTCVIGLLAIYLVRIRKTMLKIKSESDIQNKEFEKQTKELEEQTKNARSASQTKSDFLSRMSHEIRTPLNAIIGMTQVAQNTGDVDQLKVYLTNIESNSKHLLGIVGNILDFSKLESGKMKLEEKLFSLRETVAFVVNMFRDRASEKGIKLTANTENIQHDGLITDSLRLSQVLINLMSNAIKFTDEGEIHLNVEELYFNNGEAVYQFSVSDTGIGIDPKQTGKLFTSFSQASADTTRLFGGTGLGLAISKDLVAMLGGEIELETELGRGSVFTFTIHVKAKETAEGSTVKQTSHTRGLNLSGKHVLVVDDIEINCEIVSALLQETGAIIETAENGQQALDLFKSSQIGYFDLILMDIQMPVMNGYEATEEIRSLDRPDAKTVVIAAISANALPDDIQRASQVGMDGYLAKPIDSVYMYKKIGEWLEKNSIK